MAEKSTYEELEEKVRELKQSELARKEAVEALSEREELLGFALETSHTGAWALDLVNHSIFRSQELDRIFGYKDRLPDWTYEMFLEHVLPEDRAEVDEKFRQATEMQRNWSFECRIRRVDGEVRWIWVSGRPRNDSTGTQGRMAGIVQDITTRKRIEEELRQSEATLNAVLDTLPAGLVIADAKGRIVRHNAATQELWGLPLETDSWEGYGDWVGWWPETGERIKAHEWAMTRALLNGEITRNELVRNRKFHSDECRYYLNNVSPLRDAEGRIIGGVAAMTDVTDRKQMEDELRKSRDELEIRVKERTAELERTNKRLKEENQERILKEQSLRMEEARLDALLQLSRIREAPLAEMSNFILEQAIRLTHSKIGFLGFLNEDESVYTLQAVSKDIVKECNVTGDPLQWHVADAGIWAEAIRERETLFINDYNESHPGKRGLPQGHPPVERFMVVPVFEGKRIVALAGVCNKASGYDKSDERQIVLLLSGLWSYMQKRRSREELQDAYNELEKRNIALGKYNRQLEELNQELQDFAFIASHDLHEPLRKIHVFGDMLSKRLAGSMDETSRDYLQRMQSAVARMQNLLNSLLSYSRVTTKAEPMKKTDLGKCVKEALSNLEILINEKNADVGIDDLPTVMADRVQMTQLFQNLIGNALKFSRKGQAPHVKIHAKKEVDAYEIYVEDNGIGVEERYLRKIFLPFHRLHGRSSEYAGVGIGLAICKKIAERHGGDIIAKSKPGKGSTFIVTLPAGTGNRDNGGRQ